MRVIRNLIVVCSLMIGLQGCWDDPFERKASFYDVELKLCYPLHYNVQQASGVHVLLKNVATNLVSEVVSDEEGHCIFSNVPSGAYSIRASKILSAEVAKSMGDILLAKKGAAGVVNVTSSIDEIKVPFSLNDTILELRLTASVPGEILFKEVFYSGSRTSKGKAYQYNHFVELFNNSQDVLYLDGLVIGSVYGGNGSIMTLPSIYKEDYDHLYLTAAWRFPGKGNEFPLEPGKSVVVAQDGIDHSAILEGDGVDLSEAEWEIFVYRPDKQRDIDVNHVPNLEEEFMTYKKAYDWIFNPHGESLVLFRKGEKGEEERLEFPGKAEKELLKIPSEWVLDAFESLHGPAVGKFKRIPPHLDLGFTFCPKIYSNYSCRRKTFKIQEGRRILMDTNNSSEDFEVLNYPSPKRFE